MKNNFSVLMAFFLIAGGLTSSLAHAEITSCGSGTGMLFVRGEPSRGTAPYCISQNTYRTGGQDWAAVGCGLRSQLCSTPEYVQACLEGVIPATPGTWYFTSDFGIGAYNRMQFKMWGGGKENPCISTMTSFPPNSGPYNGNFRCCQR